MKFKIFIISLCAAFAFSVLLPGCAYYNTFYNAKKSYRKAEKENKDNTTGRLNTQNYQKAIDTAAKVPEFYPNSKYIDDALFLMGKCYYKIGQYPKAQRKFEELISNYPNADFLEEVKLYLGLSLIKNNTKDRADEVLTSLANLSEDEDIRVKARSALGELLLSEKKYSQAAALYKKLGENSKDKTVKREAFYKEGECYYELKDYQSASEAYKKASRYRKGDKEIRFQCRHKWGLTKRLLGDYDAAEKIFQDIRDDDKMYEYFPQVELQLAEIDYFIGNIDKAEKEFLQVAEKNKRTNESAQAYYNLAVLQRDARSDFDSARVLFNLTINEKGDSPFADSAKDAREVLNNWKAVTSSIDSLLKLIEKDENSLKSVKTDSTTADSSENSSIGESLEVIEEDTSIYSSPDEPDSGEYQISEILELESDSLQSDSSVYQESFPDSSMMSLMGDSAASMPDSLSGDELKKILESAPKLAGTEPAATDTAAVMKRISDKYERIRQFKYQLAEIWHIHFNKSDSAWQILSTLADSADYELASKSVFLMAYIARDIGENQKADSLNRILVDKFGDTKYANSARRRLNLPLVETLVDSGKVLFVQAEQKLYNDKEPMTAWNLYAQVDSLYPDSPYAPRAMFARAYIAEKIMKQDSVAVEILNSIVANYPHDSLYAAAKKRTTASGSSSRQTSSSRPGSGETEEPIRQAGSIEGERVYLPEEVTQSARALEDSAAISRLIISNNLYPQSALSARKNGYVIVSLVVDRYGYPYDMEIKKEVPKGYEFGEIALQVAEMLTYESGKARTKPVPVRIDVEIKFKLE
ncbi:tetratricopeptide repeat protein [bacterium]|nr:tetratricopeptide repeat protein [FCB group bacterium]MBL7190496.1 tetratricopeptide repeat protein [bacterium]